MLYPQSPYYINMQAHIFTMHEWAFSSKQFVLFSSSKLSLLNFVLYDIAMSYACKQTHVIVAMCTYKTHGSELCGQQIRLLGGCLHI